MKINCIDLSHILGFLDFNFPMFRIPVGQRHFSIAPECAQF